MASLQEENRELLETDFMKDAVVECGDRVWKVHKLILLTRSEWFKKALCGPFKEAQENKVVIREQDPKHVNWVITWIYCHEFHKEDFADEDDLYENYLKFAHIADFFCLRGVQPQIQEQLTAVLEAKVRCTLRYYILGKDRYEDKEAIASEFSGLIEGVEAAYKFDYSWAKSAFIDFVAQTRYWIFCNPHFRVLLRERVPGFYQDLLEGFSEFATDPHWSPSPPEECLFCDDGWQDAISNGEERYWEKISYFCSTVFALCNRCDYVQQCCKEEDEDD
ncbi:hypothetical protein F5Y05DRAFT_423901 [Hypoxylon sp. FL0543]|nr:hypothetical protein F5Y05DRAFT_423901 [Hypoxylon sp. FL0543]